MSSAWHYSVSGNRTGPVSSDRLRELAASGALGPDDLVWREGMADWRPARALKGLFPASPAKPTAPPQLNDRRLVPPSPGGTPSDARGPAGPPTREPDVFDRAREAAARAGEVVAQARAKAEAFQQGVRAKVADGATRIEPDAGQRPTPGSACSAKPTGGQEGPPPSPTLPSQAGESARRTGGTAGRAVDRSVESAGWAYPSRRRSVGFAAGGMALACLLVCGVLGKLLAPPAARDLGGNPDHGSGHPGPHGSPGGEVARPRVTAPGTGDIWQDDRGTSWSNERIPLLHDMPDWAQRRMPDSQRQIFAKVEEWTRRLRDQERAANPIARDEIDRAIAADASAFEGRLKRLLIDRGIQGWIGRVQFSPYRQREVGIRFGTASDWVTHGNRYPHAKNKDCAYRSDSLLLLNFDMERVSPEVATAIRELKEGDWVAVDTTGGGTDYFSFSMERAHVERGEFGELPRSPGGDIIITTYPTHINFNGTSPAERLARITKIGPGS